MTDFSLVWVTEIQYGITESMTNFLQQIDVEMVVSKLTLVSSTEACFQCESIGDTELFPNCNTSCWLFGFLNNKWAVRNIENIAVFVHQRGENPLF